MPDIPPTKNLFAALPPAGNEEDISALVTTPQMRIERIVSTGQASPPGFWWDQERDEWVVLLAGSAMLLFEGESGPRRLDAGDYVHIPAHVRHRLEWTDATQPTVWLAVHYRPAEDG